MRSSGAVQTGKRLTGHLACAIALGCAYFLTTDAHMIKKAIGITEIKVTDPITFVREEAE